MTIHEKNREESTTHLNISEDNHFLWLKRFHEAMPCCGISAWLSSMGRTQVEVKEKQATKIACHPVRNSHNQMVFQRLLS